MTTASELKKYGIEFGFIKKLEMAGFQLGDGFWFYRKRPPFIDLVLFWISTTKKFTTIPIICMKEDLIDHCDMSNFPKNFTLDIPFLSERFLNDEGVEIGGDSWNIKSRDEIKSTFQDLEKLICKEANTWFESIDSDHALYESYSQNMQESEQGQRMKKLLID